MRYHFLMALSRLICCLPHSWLLAVGRVLGILYYKLIKKQRNRAIKQMMESLQISEEEAQRTVRASFINMAQNVLEILYMPNLNKDNFTEYIEIEH